MLLRRKGHLSALFEHGNKIVKCHPKPSLTKNSLQLCTYAFATACNVCTLLLYLEMYMISCDKVELWSFIIIVREKVTERYGDDS
jgi:hypothetical protein